MKESVSMENIVFVGLTAEEARMIRVAIDVRIRYLEDNYGNKREDDIEKLEELYEKFKGSKWK
jgi:hypothetical protein